MAPGNFEQLEHIISAMHADSHPLLTSCADDRRLRGRSEVPMRQATSTCTYVQPLLHAPPRLGSHLDLAPASIKTHAAVLTPDETFLFFVAYAITVVFTALIAEFVATSAPVVRMNLASSLARSGFMGSQTYSMWLHPSMRSMMLRHLPHLFQPSSSAV
jgi:hypothetical protein